MQLYYALGKPCELFPSHFPEPEGLNQNEPLSHETDETCSFTS